MLADASRVAMVSALMDGTTRPVGELARAAGIGAAAAGIHLRRLVDGGLLTRHAQGRGCYFRLANDEVAAWLDALALPHALRPIPPPTADGAVRRARTCYRHLAGRLGVALCDGWLERGWLEAHGDGMRLLPPAIAALIDAGWHTPVTRKLSASRGRACLDWTERRTHVGGALGVALADGMLDAGWLQHARHGRALLPSASGLRHLASLGVIL